jgi:hypothetical protein
LLKNQIFGIYIILEKDWKIIHDNDKDLNAKDLWTMSTVLCTGCMVAAHGPRPLH